MPLNKTTKRTLKLKKSLKGLKINKRIKKKNTKKNKLFKKTRGSRNSKVHNKIRHRKNTKSTKKLTGGGYFGIKLFINGKEPKKKLGEIQPTETVESILNMVEREGEIKTIRINGKHYINDISDKPLGVLGIIRDGSIINITLDESGVNNVPIRSIPDADFASLEELKERNDTEVPRKFDREYWDQVRTIIHEQFGVEINPESPDTIFVGIGSGRQYMYNTTKIDEIYYKKYSHNNSYAPTNVQQLPPILRDKNKGNLEVGLRSYDQRIFVINMDRDINSYNNEPVLLSYLKLKYGDQLFDNFKDKIISEHETGKGGRKDNDILIHTLLDNKIIFISLKCDIELDEKHINYPLNIIGINPKNLPPHHGYFQT